MTSVSPPRRHASSLFHRHYSDRLSVRSPSPQEELGPGLFEGTDAVAQNRKVAVQRIVEVHDALEIQYQAETATSDRPISPSSPSSISSDPFTVDFSDLAFPDAEVRAFRYFVRKWDPSATPDPEFDDAIAPSQLEFEEAAIKHFFRRIALWDDNEDAEKSTKGKLSWTARRRGRRRAKSEIGKMWMVEKGRQEHSSRDKLKEVTTREGLAQLLWTLLHDPTAPLAPELFNECKEALKKKYGIKS